MGRPVMFIILATLLLTACKTGIIGIYPYPVRILQLVDFSVPQQVAAGETHSLYLEWSGGADTFTVTWLFGGATNQPVMLTSGPERSSSIDVTFNLDGAEAGTFSGAVQVVDERGNKLDHSFSYPVQAQT